MCPPRCGRCQGKVWEREVEAARQSPPADVQLYCRQTAFSGCHLAKGLRRESHVHLCMPVRPRGCSRGGHRSQWHCGRNVTRQGADASKVLHLGLRDQAHLCALRPTPKGYIDVSTVDADTSSSVAAAVREAGGLFLEAPVSGSKASPSFDLLFYPPVRPRRRLLPVCRRRRSKANSSS